MTTTPDDWLRSFERQAQEHVERATELSRRLQESSVTVESPRGEVRLTVDSTGGLSSLDFGREARDLPLDELAALVLRTSRRAQARLAETVSEAATRLYGGGSETAAFLGSTYAERFPQIDDEDEERR
jgi:DNA-binding protein YbaB